MSKGFLIQIIKVIYNKKKTMAKERIKNLSLSEQRKKEAFRKILRDKEQSSVKGVIYIIFAFLLGALGVHNFYAKYWKRGIVQFLLTVSAPFLLFFPLIFTSMWAEAELLFQNRDKDGRLFKGSRRKIWCWLNCGFGLGIDVAGIS